MHLVQTPFTTIRILPLQVEPTRGKDEKADTMSALQKCNPKPSL